jgi:hypothetical protein
MFGLWYSITGMIFGIICSINARGKKRASKEWFMLGFIFSFLAYGILYLLPQNELKENEKNSPDEDHIFISIQPH